MFSVGNDDDGFLLYIENTSLGCPEYRFRYLEMHFKRGYNMFICSVILVDEILRASVSLFRKFYIQFEFSDFSRTTVSNPKILGFLLL